MLGVDISKDWFHVRLMDKRFEIISEQQVVNRTDEIMVFISELLEEHRITKINSVFMEHTGLYIQNLVRSWMSKGGRLAVMPANQITQRLAGAQGWVGKTDFLDARRITGYGLRFWDKLQCYKLKSHTLELLLRLQRQRTRLLTAMNILKVPVAESENFDSASIVAQLKQNQASSVEALKEDLEKVDKLLKTTIEKDPYLNRIF